MNLEKGLVTILNEDMNNNYELEKFEKILVNNNEEIKNKRINLMESKNECFS